jgi:hypothetical protein
MKLSTNPTSTDMDEQTKEHCATNWISGGPINFEEHHE